MAKQKFEVEVCRTGFAFATIEVMATSQEKANELALDEAGDHDYSEKNSEYSLASEPTQTSGITAVHVSTTDSSWIRLFSTREKAIKYGALEAVANMAGHPNYTDMEVENEALDNLESSNRYEIGGMFIELENNLDIR